MRRMSKLFKTTLALLLLVSAVLVFTACGGAPTYNDASGIVGSLSWDYDAETKTLKISGAGEIPDSASSTEVPWHAVRGGVETLIVGPEVTAIGNYAFYSMSALKSADLPDSVTRIGDFAFAFSGLSNIELPASLTTIGNSAFEACSALTDIVLPLSVKTIGTRCFAFCGALTDAVLVSPLESIPEEAFYKCVKLDQLVLHPAVQAGTIPVADSAFEGAAANKDSATFREELVQTYTLTISYVYENGEKAAEPFTDSMVEGASYSRLSPVIEGYTADRDVISGEIHADVTETVTYKQVVQEETPTEPAETEPVTEEEPKDEGFTAGTAIAIVVLVLVIVAIVVGGILLVRMDKKNAKGKNTPKNQKNNKKK